MSHKLAKRIRRMNRLQPSVTSKIEGDTRAERRRSLREVLKEKHL